MLGLNIPNLRGFFVAWKQFLDITMSIILISAILGTFLSTPAVTTTPPAPTPIEEPQYEVAKSYIGEVTAYTSREEETDDTPFIAASGKTVYWGMVATNAYPFGTEIRFPDLYGEKVFVVGDRMHSRFQNRIDIWFPEYSTARKFGLKNTRIEIVHLPKVEAVAVR